MKKRRLCGSATAMAVFLWLIIAIALTSVAATDVDKKGYEVTTVFDGNKLGVAFHNIYDDAIGGQSVVALDITTISIYSVSLPLSQSSEVKRIAGGKSGHRDGSANEAQFERPRGLAIDSDGSIYVADTKNAAVRMITRAGVVTTIAGGSNRTGRTDGEGSEVTFSNDFDVTFLRSTCSLAIADRGNRLIRAVNLPQFDGRCRGATPNLPGRTFTSAELLMTAILSAIAAAVAATTATILLLSTQRLEQLQSTFCSAITEGSRSSVRLSIWKTTTMKLSPGRLQMMQTKLRGLFQMMQTTSRGLLQMMQTTSRGLLQMMLTNSVTRSSVTRSAAVEEVLVWSPALIMEIVMSLFERLLYILLCGISLLPQLLCLFHMSGTTTTTLPNETELLIDFDQQKDFQQAPVKVSQLASSAQENDLQKASSAPVKELVILEDLIELSDLGLEAEVSEDVVDNAVRIDAMVEKCLAALTAPSTVRKM